MIKQEEPIHVNYNNIWMFEQNKPSLVVKDIIKKYPDVDPDFIYEVLLKRGIFKWLAVRRDIIKLKNDMKKEIRDLNRKKNIWEKGYFHGIIKYRKIIRCLCHSERWRAPDFDNKAINFLNSLTNKNINN